MPDTKESREKQAKRREKRRRRREIREALDRLEEPEPVEAAAGVSGDLFDAHLETISYPMSTSGLVESINDREALERSSREALGRLFATLPPGTYESPSEVREAFRDATNEAAR